MSPIANRPLIENAVAGIVITAELFNPSIFSETWFIQKGIIPQDALTGLRIFSPAAVQFATENTQVMVIPQKMQITFPINDEKDNYNLQREIASQTVNLLPQTPYRALGINFDFFVTPPPDKDFNDYDRNLLGDGSYKLLHEFSTSDAKFGRYFSKDFGEARLKLDIKPVKAGPDNKDLFQFSFNFHHEVSMEDQPIRITKLIQYIDSWCSLRQYALNLIEIGSQL